MSSIKVFVATGGSPTHFPAPTFTEVTSRLLADGGVTFTSGVSGRGGQKWAAGSFQFTLSNTDGAYSGPALLRRPVLLRMSVGASNIDHRGVITDVVEYRDGVRRLVVSGTDMLGLAADLEVGTTYGEQLVAMSALSRWLLTADGADSLGSTPLVEDPWPKAPVPLHQDFSGQDPVFGTVDGCPALSGGGVHLEPAADTGFRGLYTPVVKLAAVAAGDYTASWTWGAWCYVPSDGYQATEVGGCVVASVVTADGRSMGIGYSLMNPLGGYWTATDSGSWTSDHHAGSWPRDQWVWVTFGVDGWTLAATWTVTSAGGTVLSTTTLPSWSIGEVPAGFVLGGIADSALWPSPSNVIIADAVWCNAAPSTATALLRGHVGYPGETVSARAVRLLTAANLIPAAGTWNGTAPAVGPTLADQPWTRRPLADALNEALDSGGYVIHDLPATSTTVTTLGALAPDGVDGYGATPTTISTSRVQVATDGVETNTGMLVNAATVTNAGTGRQWAYEDTSSSATYGRRAVQVTSISQSADNDASLASWLSAREASPTQAIGLPDLVLDVDGMVTDGATATVLAVAKIGATITVTGLLPGGSNYSGVVRGLQWQQTPQGAMRLTLRCQPLRPLAYALLDDTTTATLDNVILGW